MNTGGSPFGKPSNGAVFGRGALGAGSDPFVKKPIEKVVEEATKEPVVELVKKVAELPRVVVPLKEVMEERVEVEPAVSPVEERLEVRVEREVVVSPCSGMSAGQQAEVCSAFMQALKPELKLICESHDKTKQAICGAQETAMKALKDAFQKEVGGLVSRLEVCVSQLEQMNSSVKKLSAAQGRWDSILATVVEGLARQSGAAEHQYVECMGAFRSLTLNVDELKASVASFGSVGSGPAVEVDDQESGPVYEEIRVEEEPNRDSHRRRRAESRAHEKMVREEEERRIVEERQRQEDYRIEKERRQRQKRKEKEKERTKRSTGFLGF